MITNKLRKTWQDKRTLFLILIILAVTIIAFIPSLLNDFMPTWDDGYYITDNLMIRQLNPMSIKAMFITPVNGTYIPFPLISFAIEYHIFGLNPLPYHITNLVLHLACTLLVFQFLRLLKIDRFYAAFGALLFGIHPMHVESVAWITERKDLLFSLFYLCSMILYMKYLRNKDNRLLFFFFSLLLFMLSLFSKIQAVSLPLSLLLIDYYLERPLKMGLILEKIPYFILSLIFGVAGILILRNQGSLAANEVLSLGDRIFYGLYTLTEYILKFLAPFHQSAFYPYPVANGQSLPLLYYLNPFFLLALAIVVHRTIRFTRTAIFGIFFFLFNVIFLLQILSAGHAYLADRFTYIPYIGLCFIMAWLIKTIAAKKPGLKPISFIVLSLIIILFGTLTFNRCKVWKNGETLWTDVIEKYPVQSARPYVNRGLAYWNLGQPDKEIADFSKAIGIDSNYTDAYYNRGNAYWSLQNWDNALADYSRTIEIDPKYTNAYYNRGNVYWNLKNWDKAIADYSIVTELDPKYMNAYYNRGFTYGKLEQWDKAIADYSIVVEIDPRYKQAFVNRGIAYGNLGQWDKAIADYTTALQIDPDLTTAYANREFAYQMMNSGKKE